MIVDFSPALEAAVQRAKAPGAVAYVGTMEETIFHSAAGMRQRTPKKEAAKPDTLYDVASLTKVIATTTAVMMLEEQGHVDLDESVTKWLPVAGLEAYTPRLLLTHTAGLPAFKRWYREVSGIDEVLARIGQLERGRGYGKLRRYSDLGFMILGRLVEAVAKTPLDAFCEKHIFAPLEMKRTGFKPAPALRAECAATEHCAWRKRVIVGEVHDEMAFAVGGVSGHAGLFSTAEDIAKFCRGLLGGKLLKEATLAKMCARGQVASYPWQGLGWKLNPWLGGSEGALPSRAVIGHTGWTGTCLWMDREKGRFAILLSNTCHPSRQRRNNRALRQAFFTPVAAHFYREKTNAHTGLDRLAYDYFDPILGRRAALLTHSAATDELDRSILDVLEFDPEVNLKRIFTPEHGLRGQAEAGEAVASERAPVPVTSLYGKRSAPTPEELRGIQVFIVDLRDIGVRYYTYLATMKACMAACAKARVPMLILDRPNPLGGVVLEGPVAAQTDSPVCWGAVPVRHGMTLGETALFFRDTLFKGRLQVDVKTVDNWPRELMHPGTSLPWSAPSPNMPDFETALLYVGMCLFEGTNMNEGRGTRLPFQLVGAPWLDAEAVIAALEPGEYAGCRLLPATYVPQSIPGKASNPRFLEQACRGIRIHVESPEVVRAFTLATALLRAIAQRHPGDFSYKPFFDTLAGGPWLRQQLTAGTPAQALVQALAPALATFEKRRPKLYPDWTALLRGQA